MFCLIVSLRSCLNELLLIGFDVNYVAEQYLKWVVLPFYVFLEREKYVDGWQLKGLKSSHVVQYAVFRSR